MGGKTMLFEGRGSGDMIVLLSRACSACKRAPGAGPQCGSVRVLVDEGEQHRVGPPQPQLEQHELRLRRQVARLGAPGRRHPPQLAPCAGEQAAAPQLQARSRSAEPEPCSAPSKDGARKHGHALGQSDCLHPELAAQHGQARTCPTVALCRLVGPGALKPTMAAPAWWELCWCWQPSRMGSPSRPTASPSTLTGSS